jgi:hypothetical protein
MLLRSSGEQPFNHGNSQRRAIVTSNAIIESGRFLKERGRAAPALRQLHASDD